MSSAAFAEGPTVTNEVLLPADQGASLDPSSISNASDGGFILTGSMNMDGWAVKTDAKGNVLWRYSVKAPDIQPRWLSHLKILDAIAMPDGTTYLYGNKPVPISSQEPSAFLTHLDVSGHLLSTKFFAPTVTGGWGASRGGFSRGARWGDGFVFVGQTSEVIRGADPNVLPHVKVFYWILALNAAGNVKWEKQISAGTTSAAATIGALNVTNERLLFSSTDNISTDILSIDAGGTLVAQNNIAGSLSFITPLQGGADVQMMDCHGSTASIVSLDNKLAEAGRTPSIIDDFEGQAYRLADQSYVAVGHRIHSIGQEYTTAVVHLDSSFQNKRFMDFPRSREPIFIDNGRIAGVTLTREDGEFVVVRKLTQVRGAREPIDTPPVFRGAVLDFVQLN